MEQLASPSLQGELRASQGLCRREGGQRVLARGVLGHLPREAPLPPFVLFTALSTVCHYEFGLRPHKNAGSDGAPDPGVHRGVPWGCRAGRGLRLPRPRSGHRAGMSTGPTDPRTLPSSASAQTRLDSVVTAPEGEGLEPRGAHHS